VSTHVPERRAAPPELLMLVQQIHESQMQLQASQDALNDKLTAHMTEEAQELASAIERLMSDAFPAGDPAGHKRYHEAFIQQAEDKAEFWKKMRLELAKWGLLGFLGWAVVTLWQAFLHGPSR